MTHRISYIATFAVFPGCTEYSPLVSNPFPVKMFRVRAEKITIFRREEFDLTEGRVPNIIVCTSILWRADKPGVRTQATRMAPKYIFVTGGVVSSIGKSVAASSIGCLLVNLGFEVSIQKYHTYINTDS